jgi:hypothetical protein
LVRVDGLQVPDKNDVLQDVKPTAQTEDAIHFPRAERSLVWLTGSVRWTNPDSPQLQDSGQHIVVYVNRVRQLPVFLDGQDNKNEPVRRFRVPLVLTKAQANRIEVEVPGSTQQQLSGTESWVDCADPIRKQRLHLLIVGVDVNDQEALKRHVLTSLNVKKSSFPDGPQGQFEVEAFEQATLYNVLTGPVDRKEVEAQFVQINTEIEKLVKEKRWLNDLIVVYYQGSDVVSVRKDRYLLTHLNLIPENRNKPVEKYAVSCRDLPRLPGVQLMVLNVAQQKERGGDIKFGTGGDPFAGYLRFVCGNPEETRSSSPPLLALLEKVIRTREKVGEVADGVVEEFEKQQPTAQKPGVILAPDVRERLINKTNR